jgi:hypothetical protein
MTQTRTPARSTSVQPHVINHPKGYALLMLVVAALVAGMGARFTAPRAAADTGDQTFESGGYSITLTPDNTLTILDTKTATALKGTPDPAAGQISEAEIRTRADNLATQLKDNLGWDVALDTDRLRLTQEINTIHQKLDSIPQATLDLRENTGIGTLRDIIDQTYNSAECRGRCLVNLPERTILAGATLAASIKFLRDRMYQGDQIGLINTTLGIIVFALYTAQFWFYLSRTLGNAHLPERLRRALLLFLGGTAFTAVTHTVVDLIEYTAQSRRTVRQDLAEAAQRVHSLTPDTEPADDYDLVKDEL